MAARDELQWSTRDGTLSEDVDADDEPTARFILFTRFPYAGAAEFDLQKAADELRTTRVWQETLTLNEKADSPLDYARLVEAAERWSREAFPDLLRQGDLNGERNPASDGARLPGCDRGAAGANVVHRAIRRGARTAPRHAARRRIGRPAGRLGPRLRQPGRHERVSLELDAQSLQSPGAAVCAAAGRPQPQIGRGAVASRVCQGPGWPARLGCRRSGRCEGTAQGGWRSGRIAALGLNHRRLLPVQNQRARRFRRTGRILAARRPAAVLSPGESERICRRANPVAAARRAQSGGLPSARRAVRLLCDQHLARGNATGAGGAAPGLSPSSENCIRRAGRCRQVAPGKCGAIAMA